MVVFHIITFLAATASVHLACAQNQQVNCGAPFVANVPISEFVNITWYVLYTTSQYTNGRCQTLTITSSDNPSTSGKIIDKNADEKAEYIFTSYLNGVVTYKLESTSQINNYMVFSHFFNGSAYKMLVVYNCFEPIRIKETIGTDFKTIIIMASENNVPQEVVEALQKNVTAADSAFKTDDYNFSPINHIKCSYD